MTLGIKIKQLREDKGWTQGQLEAYSGVGRSYISLLEIDEIKNPSAEKLLKIAAALAVDEDVLFEAAGLKKTLTSNEQKELQQVFLLFASLNERRRKQAFDFLRFLSQEQEKGLSELQHEIDSEIRPSINSLQKEDKQKERKNSRIKAQPKSLPDVHTFDKEVGGLEHP